MNFKRYSRQMAVDGIGESGQRKLSEAKIAVIGCGALGSIVSMYLAGAGVGELIIADFDTVDISNLQRQVFFSEFDAGLKKVEVIAARIKALNSEVKVRANDVMVTAKNGGEIVGDADFVIDATDNPASKFMTDRLCGTLAIPCCIGGVEGMRGQLITILPGDARYSDIFPDQPEDPGMAPCSVAGVLGPTAGVVASFQAAEAIKFITGGTLSRHKLLDFNLADLRFTQFEV